MNEGELTQVVAHLDRLVGMTLTDVWQPTQDRLVVGFRDGSLLLMVPRGPHARLHTVASRPENPARPYSFQGACRSRLRGPLVALDKTPGEREVALRFAEGELRLRLTGRSGGVWLVQDGGVVASLDGPAPPELPELPGHVPRPDPVRFAEVAGSFDLGARAFFEARETDDGREALRKAATTALTTLLQRDVRLLDHLAADLAKTEGAATLRRRGELLAANLWQAKGPGSLTVDDWDTGEPVLLTFDDPPARAVERWFAQARRLERARERLLTRITSQRAAVDARREALAAVVSAPDAELRQWSSAAAPRGPRPTTGFAEWVGPKGEIARVGRDEKGNRRLVFQLARGHHAWMHLRDEPSAHVVLPLEKGASPPLPHLLAGAQLLLDRAGRDAGDAADVQWTFVRDLRAVPGTIASVTVSGERVLRVVSDPRHLDGWTAAR